MYNTQGNFQPTVLSSVNSVVTASDAVRSVPVKLWEGAGVVTSTVHAEEHLVEIQSVQLVPLLKLQCFQEEKKANNKLNLWNIKEQTECQIYVCKYNLK